MVKPSTPKPVSEEDRSPGPGTPSPAPKGKRRQQRAVDTRRNIIAAALTVFAENGFAAASTHAISERAGVPQPLVLYHFGSKDELWKAVANYIFAEIQRNWDERIPVSNDLPAIEQVRIEFRALFDFTLTHPALFRFMLWENRTGNERLAWLVDNHLKESMLRTVPQIAAAQAAGDMPSGDPKLFHYYLISATCALSSLGPEIAAATGHAFQDPAIAEDYWNLVERTIFPAAATVRSRR